MCVMKDLPPERIRLHPFTVNSLLYLLFSPISICVLMHLSAYWWGSEMPSVLCLNKY